MITLVRAVQTCMACPSQWDAWDDTGNYYYLRYRSGHGSVTQYVSENWVGSRGDEFVAHISDFKYGHPLDGTITLEKFAELAGLTLAPGIERTAYWRGVKNKLTGEFAGDPAALGRVEEMLKNINLDEE
jgi:hypothetical protein